MIHLRHFRYCKVLSVVGLTTFALIALAQNSAAPVSKPMAGMCPEGVALGSRCLTGRDSFGAYYWLAVPPDSKGTLVVHSHGGPELAEPKAERAAADLTRWSIWTRAGYA